MTRIVEIRSMRPEPKRDRWGRYLLPDPAGGDERAWTRATTLAHALDDTHGLTEWKRRMVLQGAALVPELLAPVPELARQIAEAGHWREAKAAKEKLGELADAAADAAGASDGSKLGTLLHTVTEYADAGRLGEVIDQVPEDLHYDVAAYLDTMDAAGIERPVEYIERIVINTRTGTAGTFDRLVRMPDGRLLVGDLKTQKTVDYGWLSIAIQLAEYAEADAMLDPDTGELVELPDDLDTARGLVMHLPVGAGECTLYELNLQAGWGAALAAAEVRGWRDRSKSLGWRLGAEPTVYVPRRERHLSLVPPAPTEVLDADEVALRDSAVLVQARHLVRSATHPDALAALWRDLDGRGLWTPELTQLAAVRKAELAQEVAA